MGDVIEEALLRFQGMATESGDVQIAKLALEEFYASRQVPDPELPED